MKTDSLIKLLEEKRDQCVDNIKDQTLVFFSPACRSSRDSIARGILNYSRDLVEIMSALEWINWGLAEPKKEGK